MIVNLHRRKWNLIQNAVALGEFDCISKSFRPTSASMQGNDVSTAKTLWLSIINYKFSENLFPSENHRYAYVNMWVLELNWSTSDWVAISQSLKSKLFIESEYL